MKNHYIQATIDLINYQSDIQKVFDRLRRTMENKGHTRLYASVLRGVLRILEKKKDANSAIVVVAKDSDVQKYADLIKATLTSLDASDDFSTEVDETIAGGIIIKNNNTIVDNSYKQALLTLYRSTTK